MYAKLFPYTFFTIIRQNYIYHDCKLTKYRTCSFAVKLRHFYNDSIIQTWATRWNILWCFVLLYCQNRGFAKETSQYICLNSFFSTQSFPNFSLMILIKMILIKNGVVYFIRLLRKWKRANLSFLRVHF